MEKIVGADTLEFFNQLFDTLDKDKSGRLDKKELELALEAATEKPEDRDFLLGLSDEDKSGSLDRNEFMFLMLISEADLNDVRKSIIEFDKYNKDAAMGSNTLDRKEVRNAIQDKVGQAIPDNAFEEFFSVLDLDRSGKLNKIEFYMLFLALKDLKIQ